MTRIYSCPKCNRRLNPASEEDRMGIPYLTGLAKCGSCGNVMNIKESSAVGMSEAVYAIFIGITALGFGILLVTSSNSDGYSIVFILLGSGVLLLGIGLMRREIQRRKYFREHPEKLDIPQIRRPY